MSKKSINLIFGCHSHQPVGNFDFVFEEAYEKAYVPFLDVLEKFPAVRVTLHFTGPLWDWFAEHRPSYIERIAALVRGGQVEIMGGGYYEPLLCAIPERDAIAQIRRMQTFCETHFGRSPRGMWLTERVWEPQMAKTLAKAGVEYTALDDTHFLCSGLEPNQLFGYYMTEDEGHTLKVFPILEKLRYLIPFHQVHESIDFLREHATEDGLRCAVIHDDGEKFGIWPGTYHSVYEEGWLEEFFSALTENQDWLHSITYSDYLEKARAIGRTYLTCASYHEMMAWALPTPMQRELNTVSNEIKADPDKCHRYGQFIRGGFWRSFLAKYEESNNIQKRMLLTSERLKNLKEVYPNTEVLAEAEKLLFQGQCNCAYWHGAFGGLYLNHLRTALYQKLIAADAIMNRLEHDTTDWLSVRQFDFDGDGNPEVCLANSHLGCFLRPTDGGTLFELDYFDKPFNFFNTLTRREEPYHDALRTGQIQVGDAGENGDLSIHELVKAKEAGLENYLAYDPYRRTSLRDHFFAPYVTVDELWRNQFVEAGDFATGAYTIDVSKKTVKLSRSGQVGIDSSVPVHLSKKISLAPGASAVEIRYDIRNDGDHALDLMFGVEFVVNFLTGSAGDRYYHSEDKDLHKAMLGERGCDEALRHIALYDGWQQVAFALSFSKAARVYRFPVETVSQSEGGQERVYQGSVVIPSWTLHCGPEETVRYTLRMEINNTETV